ncbi:carbamoyltransferase C-terminal domain-containing protein [Amycolatopsis lurida]|uniref:carbamoyltransferase C-terminal domain-containing protein n=1 Tax=Amycolatopsis lurida TaxID=31959 RepID=UPI003656594F
MIQLKEPGSLLVPVLAAENRTALEHETLDGTIRKLTESFGAPRAPGAPMEQRHMDVAAGVQAGLEAALMHVLRAGREETGLTDLCLAGGVALNCTANGLISRSGLFDRIFVQPAAGDDGSALGAALHVHAAETPAPVRRRMTMPYWGPEYDRTEIEETLSAYDGCLEARRENLAELLDEVAGLLAVGNVVAWFQGRMEFGPRALGNRSILADPRAPGMREHLNSIVKQREDFRPFAPVVRAEDVDRYFEVSPGDERRHAHMLFVVRTRREFRKALPAVTHVDGTARVQVVHRDENERLWDLIEAFGELTGVPVLLNTSFNLRGQPVIRDPETAVRTYLDSKLDHLVLGEHLVSRSRAAERVFGGAVEGKDVVAR